MSLKYMARTERFEGVEVTLYLKEEQLDISFWRYTFKGKEQYSLSNPVILHFDTLEEVATSINMNEIQSFEICGFGNK